MVLKKIFDSGIIQTFKGNKQIQFRLWMYQSDNIKFSFETETIRANDTSFYNFSISSQNEIDKVIKIINSKDIEDNLKTYLIEQLSQIMKNYIKF